MKPISGNYRQKHWRLKIPSVNPTKSSYRSHYLLISFIIICSRYTVIFTLNWRGHKFYLLSIADGHGFSFCELIASIDVDFIPTWLSVSLCVFICFMKMLGDSDEIQNWKAIWVTGHAWNAIGTAQTNTKDMKLFTDIQFRLPALS